MKIGKYEITWSFIGKVLAGIAVVFLSYYLFKTIDWRIKLLVLIALGGFLFFPGHIFKKKLPSDLEKALKDDDR